MAPKTRRPGRILDVMMPMFSGTKDDYGSEIVPPLPLSFDRVNEGRAPVSLAPLFQLPVEILNLILQHVEHASLASLAHVSRDCRQLARSRQFASIQLDYSESSFDLVVKLMRESEERLVNGRYTRYPSLGACIRRITVATDPGWVTWRHGVSLGGLKDLEEDERNDCLTKADRCFFESYLASIQLVFSCRATLPHLELIDWEDKITLSQDMFNGLACSAAQHLKLFRVSVEEEFSIELPEGLASRGWPLRSLYLDLCWSLRAKKKKGRISRLVESILSLCAPTLESLYWESSPMVEESIQFARNEAMYPLQFPRLRYLKLECVEFADSSILESLIHDGLKALNVHTYQDQTCAHFFESRGLVPSLNTLIWYSNSKTADCLLRFLGANSQLEKFSLEVEVPATLMENQLLPLLSRSFYKLTSLSLVWIEDNISNEALEMISSLRSLQQIHLSAGVQFGWQYNWQIDHGLIRKQLKKIPSLRRIAFSRDSYKFMFARGLEPPVDRYYAIGQVYGVDEPGAVEQAIGWEKRHRARMETIATRYCGVMPNLEWAYIGQIPMSVEKCPSTDGSCGRVAVALFHERDDCYTLLKDMFGWKQM